MKAREIMDGTVNKNVLELDAKYALMPLGEFLQACVRGEVPPMQTELIEVACQGGRLVYWNNRVKAGTLPAVHLGRLIDLVG